MNERIHLSRAHVTDIEEKYVLEALRSGWVAPLGPMVDRFEREVAQRCGVSGALALASGTAALHLALLELGAGPGTVVVLPSMTFAASANAVAYTGAEPVFVDSAEDANVDIDLLVETVEVLLSEGLTVAAVMTVDLFGRCCDYTALGRRLDDLGVPLVEDAAEALGATHGGRSAGSFGRAAALSFNGNKIMTTSGGGMLLSDDLALLDRARYLSTQARQPAAWYEHTEVGYNYRMSNVLAALGVGQLERLDSMISRRREIRRRYTAGFADIRGLTFLGRGPGDGAAESEDNHWLTCISLDPDQLDIDPATLMSGLDAAGIEARHLWKPMHLQPVHEGRRAVLTGVSERLFATGVTLPSGSELNDEQIDRVIAETRRVLRAS
ncbi:pyridoxal-5'-phosphate-dependent protein [Knoellia flava TL1]|uniref:Pyridoxal-5'-phosphate-dependent protein n=2 Tax=Knoellia flava TaxID=913969 RepID=A0A8H9FWI6_9MICO|nr:aminotransferase class I/II-fold pyridoxal phosphate-dependent enzyme [Knoellia flava]KGN34008.1 pyridoxal-5'-phosphate-dependent protein [Knoellia flava TL1]GGB83695.1 pyridoxal-5'-phosphate-dependent protein [Knoellia flava]